MSHHILAKLTTQHKTLDDVRTALRALEQATMKEDGCVLFSVKENDQQAGEFYLWEHWKNKEALEEHFDRDHTKEYLSLGYTDVAEYHVLNSFSETEHAS